MAAWGAEHLSELSQCTPLTVLTAVKTSIWIKSEQNTYYKNKTKKQKTFDQVAVSGSGRIVFAVIQQTCKTCVQPPQSACDWTPCRHSPCSCTGQSGSLQARWPQLNSFISERALLLLQSPVLCRGRECHSYATPPCLCVLVSKLCSTFEGTLLLWFDTCTFFFLNNSITFSGLIRLFLFASTLSSFLPLHCCSRGFWRVTLVLDRSGQIPSVSSMEDCW